MGSNYVPLASALAALALPSYMSPISHCICMVSDFFYPNCGGVENHILQLSLSLIALGHKVVVVTHAYPGHQGIKYIAPGVKVYYLYRRPVYLQATFPLLLGSMHMLRLILIRESITLVHAHQAFSTMALEACLNARIMGYPVTFTDHSLFGFADPASIVMNKILKCVLADVHKFICVSHTSKENTVLRACLPLSSVYVIPNAIHSKDFKPDPHSADKWPRNPSIDEVVIVILCRLVYRKGVDLMAQLIPTICNKHPNIRFLIGGDGPKKRLLAEMVEEYELGSRVELVGSVAPDAARDFLTKGHIFLNASLTEAFCIAIVEAASAGLVVVSTRVGGVPEVLPEDLMVLADPSCAGLEAAVDEAMLRLPASDPIQQHERVKSMYSWLDVANRTVRVYNAAVTSRRDESLLARLKRYEKCGPWIGRFFAALVLIGHLYWRLLDLFLPSTRIQKAQDPSECAVVSGRRFLGLR